jgi:hypothetical protein
MSPSSSRGRRLICFASMVIGSPAVDFVSVDRDKKDYSQDHDDRVLLHSLAWRFKEFEYEIKKHFGVEE